MTTSNNVIFKIGGKQRDIPIKAWVYRNNNGSGNYITNEIYQVIETLNSLYEPYNTNFYLLCDIDFVNNSNYANNGEIYFNNYTLQNKTAGAINVHFILNSESGSWSGKANFPFPLSFPSQPPNPRAFSCAVVYSPNTANVGRILAHEVGHTLGLYHTHHPGRKAGTYNWNYECGDCYQEAVSRSRKQGLFCVSTVGKRKCEVNGDFLCDTDADPVLTYNYGSTPYCQYLGGGFDNWRVSWNPKVENIMGHANPVSCFSYFSPLQVAKMYGYIPQIGINHLSSYITGPSALCHGQIATYSIANLPGVSNYHWESSPNFQLLSGQGTHTVTIKAINDFGGSIGATPNCGTRKIIKKIANLGNVHIEGYDQACPLFTYTYSAPYIGAADYEWTVTNGYIVSGQYTHEVEVALTVHPSNQTILDVEILDYCVSTIFGQKIITHGDPPFPEQQCYAHEDRPIHKNESLSYNNTDIIVYPNPTSKKVSVLNFTEQIYEISILDVSGRLIQQIPEKLTQLQIDLNIESYSDGVYFIRLSNDKRSITKKIIIKN